MRMAVAVGIAGAVGALARYALEGLVAERWSSFPWGTLVVNVTGCFALGFVVGALIEGRVVTSPVLRTALTVGMLGAYTTFSTFVLETFRMLEDGSVWPAAGNVVASLGLGFVGLWLGTVVGRSL
ncbi:MAG: putative fluoride ion transporter CrcB [Actinomycetota bacterium]|jgi:CrcB protein|nr:MAG: putative fluoride ion transporter CrcB [Actinomycetota bacterium]